MIVMMMRVREKEGQGEGGGGGAENEEDKRGYNFFTSFEDRQCFVIESERFPA